MGEAKRKIAFHEAGHAVIARLHGVDIKEISMVPCVSLLGDDLLANVQCRSMGWKARESGAGREAIIHGLEIDAKVAMAGEIVDQIRGGADFDEGQYNTDDQNILSAASRIVLFDRDDLPNGPYTPTEEEKEAAVALTLRLWEETVTELRKNWAAVERVALLVMSGASAGEAQVDAAFEK
jgi:hypothetical protein